MCFGQSLMTMEAELARVEGNTADMCTVMVNWILKCTQNVFDPCKCNISGRYATLYELFLQIFREFGTGSVHPIVDIFTGAPIPRHAPLISAPTNNFTETVLNLEVEAQQKEQRMKELGEVHDFVGAAGIQQELVHLREELEENTKKRDEFSAQMEKHAQMEANTGKIHEIMLGAPGGGHVDLSGLQSVCTTFTEQGTAMCTSNQQLRASVDTLTENIAKMNKAMEHIYALISAPSSPWRNQHHGEAHQQTQTAPSTGPNADHAPEPEPVLPMANATQAESAPTVAMSEEEEEEEEEDEN